MFLTLTFTAVWLASQLAVNAATSIFGLVGLLLPFALRYLPWTGHQMWAAAGVASLLIALVACWLGGDLRGLDTSSASSVMAAFVEVYGLSQLVYSWFRQAYPAAVRPASVLGAAASRR